MLFSEAKGHKVVATDAAATVGRVDGFIVDPAAQQIIGLELGRTPGAGDTLPWANIQGFGRDAVTVGAGAMIVTAEGPLAEQAGKDHALLRKRVLSTAGVELGILRDVEFDPATGQVQQLLLDQGTVDAARLIGAGSYAVVVRA
ncbi:PRC-barrel domain-containing protein [Nakamurella leprariae]|uniref:PRC-barrel domain-containing protein n=1 Tax=Nakamurella leprariae TaxID=2803911 RepID=A0A938YE52_9ACTN|nr:PRC-barrel domain-containing protein [Nakamurella leprariae]MBM9467908.1 PRC-barrel domain-containing protein [Nakamurella leprariae]